LVTQCKHLLFGKAFDLFAKLYPELWVTLAKVALEDFCTVVGLCAVLDGATVQFFFWVVGQFVSNKFNLCLELLPAIRSSTLVRECILSFMKDHAILFGIRADINILPLLVYVNMEIWDILHEIILILQLLGFRSGRIDVVI
jgi:hypothetical protein